MAQIKEVDPPRAQAKKVKKNGPPTIIRYYLVVYNVLSALGWSYILICTIIHLFDLDASHTKYPQTLSSLRVTLARYLSSIPYLSSATTLLRSPAMRQVEAQLPPWLVPIFRRAGTTYARVGTQTAIVQTFAVLEVFHVLLGWVRSPLPTTLMQVSSRLYLVWGITYLFKKTRTNPLYASMVLSWSLTEVVRYSFYAFALLGSEPRFLLFLRYTLFYVLYPTGASSEAFLIYASLPLPSRAWFAPTFDALHVNVRTVLFLIWWPGLYVMISYMVKQRRKVLGTGPARGRTLGGKFKSS